jgi:hypothetical protein
MNTDTDIPSSVYAESGPVAQAALILATAPALRDHVWIVGEPSRAAVTVEQVADDVPYRMWGSGAQRLWLLLLSICSHRHEVSLLDVVSHLDNSNATAVQHAVAALCRR